MANSSAGIAQRKADHIAIAASGEVNATASTLLEHIHFIHCALPELTVDAVELATTVAGITLRAPVLITGMTGGTPEAKQINYDLALAAQAAGVALGLGSQRPMLKHPELTETYQVRAVAPDVTLFGNLGGVTAAEVGVEAVIELARRIEVDAMCIHLNPAQEMIQPEGDREFSGVLATIAALVEKSPVPIIVKETGCGISLAVAKQLRSIGVETVDVAGTGGTSWTAVEAKRAAADSAAAALGHEYWNWGIPTAVTAAICASTGLGVIASGGIRTGLDIARSLSLGASCGGAAAPFLIAQRKAGKDGVAAALEQIIASIRTACVLTGSRRVSELSSVPKYIAAPLADYLRALGVKVG